VAARQLQLPQTPENDRVLFESPRERGLVKARIKEKGAVQKVLLDSPEPANMDILLW